MSTHRGKGDQSTGNINTSQSLVLRGCRHASVVSAIFPAVRCATVQRAELERTRPHDKVDRCQLLVAYYISSSFMLWLALTACALSRTFDRTNGIRGWTRLFSFWKSCQKPRTFRRVLH
ncbi:hypothetical protein OUZ56_031124 [Daphnia magna]|uniref:Uncharacterized protein n=1 Tax=Daphnia magna TaxID=35525 RepID=A0ABQ9ZTB4_9CRUS|nr:hypothetical protein OUZ56_031124 [Daphnia magna]